MSRRISPPKIDPRTASDLLARLRAMAPHYTREWSAKDEDDPGVALLHIFSFIAEGVISRLNRAPERNFLAFLDMLGIRRLAATPARAPVRFLVAQGTEDKFIVPKGTQVAAPPADGRPVELPFETREELLAVPALLSGLVAVDPEMDRIYKPPPGFLTLQTEATDLPLLTVRAFSAAGSKSLQFDPPGQVQEGDYLRFDQPLNQVAADSAGCSCDGAGGGNERREVDYPIVSGVKGAIVTLTEPLTEDHTEGSLVRKVTKFDLFEGKNFQEHILYLAHGEYLDLKSEARIMLTVEYAPGSAANLQPLTIAWEFFGEQSKVEGWHAFEVEADGTAGLSRDGEVRLRMPAAATQAQLNETEINGNKSRWIRARLVDPIPATMESRLPRLESITLTVSRDQTEGIAADQAFHNDTPLTVTLPFNPFGPEPRIFDRFYIASQEAFSKPGAAVTLDVKLDFSDLLATPTAIFKGSRIRAFANGAASRLLEFQINPAEKADTVAPSSHQTPVDSRIVAGSALAVVEDSGKTRVGVFAKGEDGRIYLRLILSDTSANWIPLSPTPPGELQFDPAAGLRGDGFGSDRWQVFIVVDNRVFSLVVDPINPPGRGNWEPLSGAAIAASTPFVMPIEGEDNVWVLVTDLDGKTRLHKGQNWEVISPDDVAYLSPPEGRPFGSLYTDSSGNRQVRVHLRNRNNELVVFDTENHNDNLGKPYGVDLDSNPYVVKTSERWRVYVRGVNSQLYEWDSETRDWRSRQKPENFNLAGDPAAVSYALRASNQLSILSTSDKNALLEFRIRDMDTGTLRAGPREIVLLEDPLDFSQDTYFIHITGGPGSGSDADAVRKIRPELSRGRFAVLERSLAQVATDETVYDLFRHKARESDKVVAATNKTVTLKPGTNAAAGDFVFAKNQLREIESLDGDKATLTKSWDDKPAVGTDYELLSLLAGSGKKAQSGSARRAVLAISASNTQDFYKGLFITIAVGGTTVIRQIAEYDIETRSIVLREADAFPDPPPATGSAYQTTEEIWLPYALPEKANLRPELSWEYWNGSGWVYLYVKDSTENFLVPGMVTFQLPTDIARTAVAGQENYWIRARIIGGDYGRELFVFDDQKKQVEIRKDPIRPPLINELKIFYDVKDGKLPEYCLTFNNLSYLDQTAANNTADKHFRPYEVLPVRQKALFLGFDKAFGGGPVRLYIAAKELPVDERNKPKLLWEMASDNEWKPLTAEDRTAALTKPEIVTWVVPGKFQRRQYFGEAFFWVRATQTEEGAWSGSPLLSGVFLNTVETAQARTVRNEILGSSQSAKNERFRFQQLPVLEGEVIRVRESLTDEERRQLIEAEGETAVSDVRDQQGRVLETWVKWKEVIEFFDSGALDRHYRLDRASGELEFGDGVHGRIPSAGGDNIRAFVYQAGGGAAGNVPAGAINAPVTAIAGVESVINPSAAGGGSEAATPEQMLEIGPAQLSNRGRAVTPDDFEWLAKEASREVRKALCLQNRNRAGRYEVGWVSLYLVPDSKDANPKPSLELRRTVQRYVAERADVTVVDQEHIFVGEPLYVPVDVEVTIFAKSFDVAGTAERRVRDRLDQFLHPLTGGPQQDGWDFGRNLAASDLYVLLEEIEEVGYVGELRLRVGDFESGEQIEVGADALVASGTHTVTVMVENGGSHDAAAS